MGSLLDCRVDLGTGLLCICVLQMVSPLNSDFHVLSIMVYRLEDVILTKPMCLLFCVLAPV